MKTLHLFVISLSLLVAAGCASTAAHSSRAARAPARTSSSLELLVISAVYGSGTNFADVTYRVDDLLRQRDVEFFARPEWLHADPAPGWNKALVIVYEMKGQRRVFTAGEGGRVSVDLLMEQPAKPRQLKKKKAD